MGIAELRNPQALRSPETQAPYEIPGWLGGRGGGRRSPSGRKTQLAPKYPPRASGGDSRCARPDSNIAESRLVYAPTDAVERYRAI